MMARVLEFERSEEACSRAILPRQLRAYRCRNLISPLQARWIRAAIRARGNAFFDKGPDTVDRLPSYERFIVDCGRVVDEVAEAIGLDFLFGRTEQLVRPLFGKLKLSQALIRRYVPEERREHPAHFDAHAQVTLVIALNSHKEYEGGYFAQPECTPASRCFVCLECGDGFLHEFDLRHGVSVRGGVRYSLVCWFAPAESVGTERTPWLQTKVSADATYLTASAAIRSGIPSQARYLFEKAAAMGSAEAMLNRGVIAREEGDDCAFEWFARAGREGHHPAAMRYAAAALSRRGQPYRAIAWLHAAAKCGDAEAMHVLWALKGDKRWLSKAAAKGHPDACVDWVLDRAVSDRAALLALRCAIANGAAPRALTVLGRLFAGDLGIAPAAFLDLGTAFDAYCAAASLGDIHAVTRIDAIVVAPGPRRLHFPPILCGGICFSIYRQDVRCVPSSNSLTAVSPFSPEKRCRQKDQPYVCSLVLSCVLALASSSTAPEVRHAKNIILTHAAS